MSETKVEYSGLAGNWPQNKFLERESSKHSMTTADKPKNAFALVKNSVIRCKKAEKLFSVQRQKHVSDGMKLKAE